MEDMDRLRKVRTGTKLAMRRNAATRQCPKCERKSALKSQRFGDGTGVIYCRWQDCDYEKGWG